MPFASDLTHTTFYRVKFRLHAFIMSLNVLLMIFLPQLSTDMLIQTLYLYISKNTMVNACAHDCAYTHTLTTELPSKHLHRRFTYICGKPTWYTHHRPSMPWRGEGVERGKFFYGRLGVLWMVRGSEGGWARVGVSEGKWGRLRKSGSEWFWVEVRKIWGKYWGNKRETEERREVHYIQHS